MLSSANFACRREGGKAMIRQTVKIAAGLLLSVLLVTGAVNGAEPPPQLEQDWGQA